VSCIGRRVPVGKLQPLPQLVKEAQKKWAQIFLNKAKFRQLFDCYALAKDGSNKVTGNAQLIFIRDIDKAFHIYEGLASLCSLKGNATGEAFFPKRKGYQLLP
jgi:hypothetical protein